MIDWQVFSAAVAIGAAAELLTLNHPSKYRRGVAFGKVLAVAGVVSIVPAPGRDMALLGLLIARIGDVVGEFVHTAVVRMAVWWDGRQWRTDQNRTAVSAAKPTTPSEPTSTGR